MISREIQLLRLREMEQKRTWRDRGPRYQHRPAPRRQKTRRQAVLLATKEVW